MTAALQTIVFVLVGALGTAVVFTREARRQVLVFSVYGVLLAVLFAVLQAPDVALSEIAVGSVALPFALLATLVKLDRGGAE